MTYDNRFDGYLGWDDDAEYAQFERDYEEWQNQLNEVPGRGDQGTGILTRKARGGELGSITNDSRDGGGRTTRGPGSPVVNTAHLDMMDHLGRTP